MGPIFEVLGLSISERGSDVSALHVLQLGYIHIGYCENFSEIALRVGEIQQPKVTYRCLCHGTIDRKIFRILKFALFGFLEIWQR